MMQPDRWDPYLVQHLRRWLAAVVSTAVTATTLHAGPLLAQKPDTLRAPPEPLFTRTDAYYAGGFLAAAAALAPVDLVIAHQLRDSTGQANRFLQSSATGLRLLGNPGVLAITSGMYAAGRLTDRPELADVGLHATEAILLAGGTTVTLKVLVGRARPRQDPDDSYDLRLGRGWLDDENASFPSGHAMAAFATAASLSVEFSRLYPEIRFWVRPVLYGGAGLVGLSRMYNNDHWASDVIVGAAIGTFAGWKVVRYNHAHPGNRVDRWLLSGRLLPEPGGGIRVMWIF